MIVGGGESGDHGVVLLQHHRQGPLGLGIVIAEQRSDQQYRSHSQLEKFSKSYSISIDYG